MPNFNEFKEKMLTQIELLSTSNKTAYAFLRKKFKDIPSKPVVLKVLRTEVQVPLEKLRGSASYSFTY